MSTWTLPRGLPILASDSGQALMSQHLPLRAIRLLGRCAAHPSATIAQHIPSQAPCISSHNAPGTSVAPQTNGDPSTHRPMLTPARTANQSSWLPGISRHPSSFAMSGIHMEHACGAMVACSRMYSAHAQQQDDQSSSHTTTSKNPSSSQQAASCTGGQQGSEAEEPKPPPLSQDVHYIGPLSQTHKLLKRISITNTLIAMAAAPAIIEYADVSYASRIGLATSLVLFGVLTTGALHWMTNPYVHELKYHASSGLIDVKVTSLFGRARWRQFHVDDAQPLPWNRPVATFVAKNHFYYIDIYSFPDEEVLKKLTPPESEVPPGYKDDKDDD